MRGERQEGRDQGHKERKIAAGIYRVRCAVSGETWVGQTPNLEHPKPPSGSRFAAAAIRGRICSGRGAIMGPKASAFDVIERLPEEESPYVRDALLKERLAHWRATLQARTI